MASELARRARERAAARRRRAPRWAPEPPFELPPASVVHVPGRGEFFVRDSRGDGPPVLLLHGWMVSADINWCTVYQPLIEAGYRVLAMDHRGHGRGLRTPADFRLEDCADDAAAVLEELGSQPALAVGYSMGGPIASLLAHRHPSRVAGLVACATAPDWREPRLNALWNGMAGLRLVLSVFPQASWRAGLRALGFPHDATTTWFSSELTRGSASDIAEAGRELGRYDGRPWLPSVQVPAAVVVTTRDTAVPPRKQRELAALLRAETFEVEGDHAAVGVKPREFCAALLAALERVRTPARAAA